jgi:hypothetical protein
MVVAMTQQEIKVSNVGGVWNTHPHWPALYWGSGVDDGVLRLELIAEDWTFTFKTVEQKFSALNLHKRYGP